jgi:hypothetical protein
MRSSGRNDRLLFEEDVDELEFRDVFARALTVMLGPGYPAARLASELGISRQALHKYFKLQATPSAVVFVRALTLGVPFPGISVDADLVVLRSRRSDKR